MRQRNEYSNEGGSMKKLEVFELTHAFATPLFSELSFALDSGDIIHIQGVNGSGKTTLLRVLLGLTPIQQGQVNWYGQPLKKAGLQMAEKVFFQSGELGIKARLSVRENLRLWLYTHYNALQGSSDHQAVEEKILTALDSVNLLQHADQLAQRLSSGQRRRLAMARMYLSAAEVWVLDEPFSAVDQPGRALLKQLLETHLHAGGAVLLTSHELIKLEAVQLQAVCLS